MNPGGQARKKLGHHCLGPGNLVSLIPLSPTSCLLFITKAFF